MGQRQHENVENIPQGLKPGPSGDSLGAAEAVPFQNRSMVMRGRLVGDVGVADRVPPTESGERFGRPLRDRVPSAAEDVVNSDSRAAGVPPRRADWIPSPLVRFVAPGVGMTFVVGGLFVQEDGRQGWRMPG